MFIKNKQAQAFVLAAVGIFFTAMPFSNTQAAELSDNDPKITAICNCVESEQAAQSPNCQRLFADMFPEQQQQHSRMPAAHSAMMPPGGQMPPAQTPPTGGR